MNSRPNIVLLFSDQHRADVLGAAGHKIVQTPNLDRIAEAGAVFEDAYCQAPVCVPSRVSLLTERYVRDHGAFENDYEPKSDLPTIAQGLRDQGYATVAIGKMHFYLHPEDVRDDLPRMHELGFSEVHEEVGKLSAGFVTTDYSDYLAERGLLEEYRQFSRERNPLWRMSGKAQEESVDSKPTWAVDPAPLPAEHYLDTYVGKKARDWIEAYDADEPFFLWVGFPGPHDPWDAPQQYVDRYIDADIPLDSTKRPDLPQSGALRVFMESFMDYSSTETLTDDRIREIRRHYFANVTIIDEAIGEICKALKKRDGLENTWIIYTTDHGEMLGTHGLLNKMVFYEPAVKVPMLIRPPGGSAPQRISGLVEHVDLSATIRDIAGAGTTPEGAGRSFAGVFAGETYSSRECVVSQNYGLAMWRTERYKLVAYERDATPIQLFDLAHDPEENENVIASESYADVVDHMMESHARPFLSRPSLRPGPDLIERSGKLGVQAPKPSSSPGPTPSESTTTDIPPRGEH